MNGLCSLKDKKVTGILIFQKLGKFFFNFSILKSFPNSEMDSPIKKSLYQNVLPFSKLIYGGNFMLIDQFLL